METRPILEPQPFWLFQARPDRFDLTRAIEEDKLERWEANQYAQEMKPGDTIYFYQSGERAGLYGWGSLESESYSDDRRKGERAIDVVYHVRFDTYIPKDRFATHPVWEKHQLLTAHVGTNFKVTPDQANMLNGLIREFGYPAPEDAPGPLPSLAELFERLSTASRRVMRRADGLRAAVDGTNVDVEHMVVALFDEGSVRQAFERAALDSAGLRELMAESATGLPESYGTVELSAMPALSEHVTGSFQAAHRVAADDQSGMIKPLHLLHGVLWSESPATQLLKSRTPPLEPPPLSDQRLELRNKAVSDVWALEDLLNFEQLAIAVTDPILTGVTKPPLTVAIQAPWGHGKTTLMRMIQHQLDPRAEMEALQAEIRSLAIEFRDSTRVKFSYAESGLPRLFDRLAHLGSKREDLLRLRSAIKELKAPLGPMEITVDPTTVGALKTLSEQLPGTDADSGQHIPPSTSDPDRRAVFDEFFGWFKKDVDSGGMLVEEAGNIPTVWFNPLYYEKQDQVWAGLAHAILHRLSERLPTRRQREEFWLRLRMKRLDEDAIRRDLHKMLFERFLPMAVGYLVLAVALIVALALKNAHLLWWVPGLALPAGLAGLNYRIFVHRANRNWTLDGKFEAFVQEPDYRDRMGYLHLVDTDIDRALQLLTGRRPVAVFIDDLDRCTPDVVADVILAINQFISVRDRNVFFFLGIDGQRVADALERAKALPKDIAMTASGEKSFGWHFLEKFVNLPFFIPRLSETAARGYMQALMEEGELQEPVDPKPPAIEIQSTADASLAMQDARTSGDRERLNEITRAVSRMLQDPQSDEVAALVREIIADIEWNPRMMKRYLAAARLLRNVQISFGEGDRADNPRLLVIRAAQLLLNWPQVIACCQDDQIEPGELERWAVSAASNYETWEARIKDEIEDEEMCNILGSPDFFAFVEKTRLSPPNLPDIFSAGIF